MLRTLRASVHQQSYILIVETDDLIRGLLERWLGEAGYAVVAGTLQKLLEKRIRQGMPRLIIADIPSPRGAATLIQSLQEVYSSPMLILSARFRRGLGVSASAARQLGVRRVLPKPFTRAELIAAVRESIEASE